MIFVSTLSSKNSVFKMLSAYRKARNLRFQIPPVRRAFPFREGLMWTLDLTVKIWLDEAGKETKGVFPFQPTDMNLLKNLSGRIRFLLKLIKEKAV